MWTVVHKGRAFGASHLNSYGLATNSSTASRPSQLMNAIRHQCQAFQMFHLSYVFCEAVCLNTQSIALYVTKRPMANQRYRDLLQRHYTVHGKDQNQEIIPAANGMIPKSAGRTPIACSNVSATDVRTNESRGRADIVSSFSAQRRRRNATRNFLVVVVLGET